MLVDKLGAVSDEADGLHTGVWERRIAGELWQALHCILERIDRCVEILFEYSG